MSSEEISTEGATAERVTLDDLANRLSAMCIRNSQKVTHFEGLLNHKLEEISTRIDNIQAQSGKWHIKTTSAIEENKQLFKEIMKTLGHLIKNERVVLQITHEIPNTTVDSRTILQSMLNFDNQQNYANQNVIYTSPKETKPSIPNAVMIPPPTAIPTFAGKHTERPKQFLIHVKEYAEIVHG